MELAISSVWLAIVAWLILRAVRQRGLLPRLVAAPPPSGEQAPHLTVIVPARDEEANIALCLQSLLAQDYPASRLSVLVVDDHSADATAAIVRALAARHRRIALIQSPPLPPRWVGKSHALWIGVRTVAPETEWLCFIDAGLHIAATLYFRIPFWYGLLFPFGYTAGTLMALDSVRRRRSGQVSWKGRIYS